MLALNFFFLPIHSCDLKKYQILAIEASRPQASLIICLELLGI